MVSMAAQNEIPESVGRMKPGCWYRISGDRPDLGLAPTERGTRYLQDTDPARDERINPARGPKEKLRRWIGRRPYAPWQGRCGFPSITEAWNGAVFASRFGACGSMVIFGGGHDDYFGSSMHVFDLATRRWSRVTDGYIGGSSDRYGAGAVYPESIYPDGSPLPPHTYGYVQYDHAVNDYLLFKGQTELGRNVQSIPIPHLFNLDSLTWRRGPKHPAAILGSGGFTTWDATRRVLWGHSGDSGNGFVGFTPDGDKGELTFGAWSELYPKKIHHRADHNAMCIDPLRDIIVATNHAANRLIAIDPKEPSRDGSALNSTGIISKISPYAQLEYSANLDRLIYYSANDGAALHSIAAPSGSCWRKLVEGPWQWESLVNTMNGLDPITDAASISAHAINREHVFGRFRVASYGKIDMAILVRHTDSPVYSLKLNDPVI